MSWHHAYEINGRIEGMLEASDKDEFKALAKKHKVQLYGVPFKSVNLQKGGTNKKRRLFSLF